MLQDYCRRLGVRPSDQEIRDLAVALRALPKGHPLLPLLHEAPDFRTEAGLADALLHPRDRAYAVPQFFDLIEGADLAFGRWLRQAPYLPQCGTLADTPHSDRLAALPMREQYAAVELFRGTMLRHSAVLYRSDDPGLPHRIDLAGDAWPDYVPLRMPDTICVQERLPSGAAGVLINQSHTYTDLYLPIDALEKRLFDAIDGQRTIGEIARAHGQPRVARAFFEQLWWYDQVVFDASRPPEQELDAWV
jgi:hypothetical protein